MEVWRLIDTGRRPAAENMALDDTLLECRARGLIPDTVRFLQFDPPAVLVGYHQVVEHEVRTEYCEAKGIDINRRITGGGAIYFDYQSLGWELIASKDRFRAYDLGELYERMCQGAILGLRTLGIGATFRPKNDIEVGGRKISGTGGTERDGALLFQGTLLIDFDVETMLRALRIPIVKLKDKEIRSAKERVTCVRWELGHLPSLHRIKEALKEGFERSLNAKLDPGDLTPEEESMFMERLSAFRSERWIFQERRPLNEAVEVHAVDKTPGGLIRVSMAMDKGAGVIKSILITGDFFAYPPRAILDLEATLKYTPCDEDAVREAVYRFFKISKARVPGASPGDFVRLILSAMEKTRYENVGISPTEANDIYTIAGSLGEHFKRRFDHLLLPYCAKHPACGYRKKEGCDQCGECSVGSAYELAEECGVRPMTIQNFEHLMATLKELKHNGTRGYVGCCCEAFYCKHLEDLKQAGVPGILVDIDNQTCYDLGREKEALDGSFEGWTELKLDLLRKLINHVTLRRNNGGGLR
ncbi:MAG: DUF116 domain-containing protein [Candidatus Bathyarchaeia archaeon]